MELPNYERQDRVPLPQIVFELEADPILAVGVLGLNFGFADNRGKR